MENNSASGYWKATLGLLTKILIIWFVVSFGAGILFAPALNSISLGGYPLGFWFAHQGSIYIFIALIFYYAKKMGVSGNRAAFLPTSSAGGDRIEADWRRSVASTALG